MIIANLKFVAYFELLTYFEWASLRALKAFHYFILIYLVAPSNYHLVGDNREFEGGLF